jgi:hypothetical protein
MQMGFDVLNVRSYEDTAVGTGMYPVAGDGDEKLAPEALDGANLEWHVASALAAKVAVPRSSKPVIELRKIHADVAISGQRVAVICDKYDKGGGYFPVGGLTAGALAVTMNSVSKIRAANRRKGNCFVGHVRYQWLYRVCYLSQHLGPIGVEKVRLILVDGTEAKPRPVALDLELAHGSKAALVARRVVERATQFWLDNGVPNEKRASFEALAGSEPHPYETDGSNNFMSWEFPMSLPAKPGTALLG